MKFKDVIKNIRTELKLSHKQFAGEIGLSRWVTYRWESGNIKNPTASAIYRIKKLCNKHNTEFSLELNHIKEIRARLGLGQKEFGKLIFGKVCKTTVSCWEAGRRVPNLKSALAIVALAKKNGYDITIEDLVADAGKMVKEKK